MTLEVVIGKYKFEKGEEQPYFSTEQCPILDYDLCSKEYTLWPRESFRSGSTSFRNFFTEYNINILGEIAKNEQKGPHYLKQYIEEINEMNEDMFLGALDVDRFKWLKFWCNKAIELYGDEAVIELY